jgi:hypothetical protein
MDDVDLTLSGQIAATVTNLFALSHGEARTMLGLQPEGPALSEYFSEAAEFPARDWRERLDTLSDLGVFVFKTITDNPETARRWLRETRFAFLGNRTAADILFRGSVDDLRRMTKSLTLG